MVRTLISVVAVGFVVAALAPVAVGGAAAQQDVTLTVTVLNHNDNPVQGAELTAEWDGGSVTEETRANGQALMDVPEGADVEVSVAHERYVRNRPLRVEDASTREVEMNVWLSGTVRVNVVDADGSVADVRLTFRDPRTVATVRTGENGVATTDRLERGEYQVTAFKPGYLENEFEIDITGTTGAPVEVRRRVEIERGTVSVQFNVTDDHFDTPRPLPNARIEIGDDSLTTRDTGLRSIDLPVNRNYDVRVSKDGYEAATERISVEESDTRVNISIRRTPELAVSAANDRVVIGESTQVTVTDAYDEPVAGATVSVDGSEVGQTGQDGTASVRISEAGEREITVTLEDLSESVTVEGVDPDAEDEATPTDTPTDTPTPGEDGSGFGVVAALLALTALAVAARQRS